MYVEQAHEPDALNLRDRLQPQSAQVMRWPLDRAEYTNK